MATAVGAGFDLSKLLSEFSRLDKELEKFMQKGKTFEKNWQDIFNNMGQGGLKNFASQLASVRKSVVDFGKQKVGVQWDSKSLQKYIDDVNKLILVIKAVQKETKKENIKGVSIVGLKKELNEAQELLVLVKRAEKSLQETSTNRQQTYKGSLRYSNSAKTIEQDIQAIKNLESARAKLKRTDDDYEKKLSTLNNRIREHKKRIDAAKKGAQELQDKHHGLINTGEQLKRALLGVFSVSAIKGYVSKLVEVRGEFELQHRALQVLVGDVSEANRLWDKTVQLAVKSPFAVKELVTYTKQLAAYRVESDKLYDTTKMLADISAGLGVDMNRLILAYGQVKAANYLRGTELRQFSEAGINILSELSKYFTELEGRAVSVGDVFDRVSKRMVSFADVEAVLQGVTGVGGQFYKMQEQQAETLKGVWMNMRDSIDLMLNEIGSKNSSILKGTLSIAKSLVDNWEKVGNIIVPLFSMIIAKMAVMRTMSFFDEGSFKVGIDKMSYIWKLLTKGRIAADEFASSLDGVDAKSLKMSAIGTGVSAVILLIAKLTMEFVKHRAELKAIDKEYENIRESLSDTTFNFNVAKNEGDLKKQKDSLNELVSIANKEYSLGIKVDINTMTQEEVDAKVKEITGQMLRITSLAQEAEKSGKGGWFANIFTEDANEDAEDYGDAFSNVSSKIILHAKNAANALIEYKNAGNDLTEVQKAALEQFTTPFDPKKDTEVQYVIKLTKAYQKLNEEANKRATQAYWEEGGDQSRRDISQNYGISEDVGNAIKLLEVDKKRFNDELNRFFDEIDKNLDRSATDEQKRIDIKAVIDRQSWSDSAKEFAYQIANDRFDINITPIIKQPEEKALAEWQIEYNKFVDTLSTNKVLKMDANTDAEQYISILKGTYETYAKEVSAWDAGNAKARAQYSEEEIESIRKQNNERKQALDWLVYEEKKKSDENEALQRLKTQISLIREAARAYDEMRKLHDEAYAEEHVTSEYGAAFKEAGLGNIGGYAFGTREDELNNLNKLKNSAAQVKDGMLELSKATAQVGVQVDNANQELADKRLFDAISDIFSNYEISLEMDKLNIPPDLAKRLFGLDSISLEELRPAILEKFNMSSMKGLSNVQIYESDEFKSMSEARQKELKESLEKEAKMTKDARIERLKTYSQYLVKEQHERIKFKMEEIRKLSEIDAMNEFNEDEKAVMKENIRREANENMAKSYWEDFEKSPMFVNLFDDMELATNQSLNNMKTHLESMRDSMIAAGLPASDLKDILDKINQVEEELESRDPFNKLKSFGAVMFGTGGDSTVSRKEFKEAKANEATYLKEAEILKKNEESTLRLVAAKKEELNSAEAILAEFQKGTDEYRVQENAVNQIREEYSGLVRQHQYAVNNTEENNKKLDHAQKITKQWKEQVKDVGDGFSFVQNAVNQVGDALSTTLQQTGLMGEDDAAIFDSAMNVANSALGLGASIASGDIVGIITNGLSLIGDIAATGDAAKQKAINAELEKAKQSEKIYNDLVDEYEKLQKAMEKAFTIEQMNDSKRDLEENMDAQSDSIDEQIAALEEANAIEADKKKTDQAAIDERNAQIEELRKQQEELIEQQEELDKQFVETMGGSYDYTGVAEQFLDAWLTAFEETGNGMSGLEDSFDDFWDSVLKKQVVYGGASEIMKQYMDKINAGLSDGKLTDKEISDIEAKEEETKNKLNEFYEWANEKYGLAEFDSGADKLSGLQAGIQGITEEQADILAAYWNAVRFSTASIDYKMDDSIAAIKNILKNTESDSENPIVANLKAIARNTDYIYALLSDVRGGAGDLSYMKVQLV